MSVEKLLSSLPFVNSTSAKHGATRVHQTAGLLGVGIEAFINGDDITALSGLGDSGLRNPQSLKLLKALAIQLGENNVKATEKAAICSEAGKTSASPLLLIVKLIDMSFPSIGHLSRLIDKDWRTKELRQKMEKVFKDDAIIKPLDAAEILIRATKLSDADIIELFNEFQGPIVKNSKKALTAKKLEPILKELLDDIVDKEIGAQAILKALGRIDSYEKKAKAA